MKPEEFFQEQLLLACQNQAFSPNPQALNYLSGLLSQFIQSENLFQKDQETGRKSSETIAFLYHEAQQAESPLKAIESYRRVGDVSLVVSGFFADQFTRKIVDIDYFMNMGGHAYSAVATRAQASEVQKLFSSLSMNFSKHVNLVAEIADRSFAQSTDILRTYEKWLKTKNRFLEKKLREEGIEPINQDDTTFKH